MIYGTTPSSGKVLWKIWRAYESVFETVYEEMEQANSSRRQLTAAFEKRLWTRA